MSKPDRAPRNAPAILMAASLVLGLAVAGCSTWKPVPATAPLAGAPPQRFAEKIRVTLKSGEKVEVETATLDADSLRGVRVDKQAAETMSAAAKESRSHYAVAAGEIQTIESNQADRKKTKTFVFAAIGIVVLIALASVIGDD